MKRKISFAVYTLTIITFLIFNNSCNIKQEKKETKTYKTITPKRIIKDKILIVLGKDYSKRPNILNYLKNEYNLKKENSPIEIISYDDMTTISKYPRLKIISEKIAEHKSTIVISLGIPEGGGRYLIDEYDENEKPTIISLLPMDEILPLEAGSDIVIDFDIPKDILSDEKDFSISDQEVEVLLITSIFTAEYLNAKNKKLNKTPIEEFREAFFTTQQVLNTSIFDGNYKIDAHIDSETGIPSRKYFIISEKKKETEIVNEEKENNNEEDTNEENTLTNPDNLEGGA